MMFPMKIPAEVKQMAKIIEATVKILDTSTLKMTRGFYPSSTDKHKGVDLIPKSTSETPAVLCFKDGTVAAVGNVSGTNTSTLTPGMGTYVAVQHPDSSMTRYQHLKAGSLKVKPGDSVKAGQKLGTYGRPTTGNSTGPHLHFDISLKEKPKTGKFIKAQFLGATRYYVDPVPYLTAPIRENTAKYICTASLLRIRKEPSLSSAVVGYVKNGETVTVTEVKNGFGRVKTGWCSMQYLRKVIK